MKAPPLFLFLGLLAVALIAGTAFIGHNPQAELSPEIAQTVYSKFDQNALRKVHLEREGLAVDVIRTGEGNWEVAQAGGFPASDLLPAVLEMVAGLRIDDQLSEGADREASDESLALYKLTAKAGLRITLTGEGDRTVADLWVGCMGPGRSGAFFRRADRNEVLVSFDSRLPGLPVESLAWVRTEMGLIDPHDLTIELQKIGQPKVSIINYRDQWMLQGLKRGPKNELLESADTTSLQTITRLASTLSFDGLVPAEVRPDSLEFSDAGPQMVCRNTDGSVEARVEFAPARKMAGLRSANGLVIDEAVVPMRIRITMRDPGQVPEYVAYYNRKAGERLYWMRQGTFDQLFVPRDRLVLPLTPTQVIDPSLLNPLAPHNTIPPQP